MRHPNDAPDLTQEIFERFMQIPQKDAIRDAQAYLYGIASHLISEWRERIELRHGEAVFKVAQDRTRPFSVHTRAAVVVAVGTQFNVYDRPEGTDVTVLEGRVRVMARSEPARSAQGTAAVQDLAAGEEARITPDGTIRRLAHPDVERVIAWSKRRLKFERASLDEIVREFNRYNPMQLRIEGIAPDSRFYRGIFDADDPGSLATLLSVKAI